MSPKTAKKEGFTHYGYLNSVPVYILVDVAQGFSHVEGRTILQDMLLSAKCLLRKMRGRAMMDNLIVQGEL